MGFLVSDRQIDRHAQIRALVAPGTATIALVLAAIDWEWTVRRVLDQAASAEIQGRENDHVSGTNGYAKLWNRLMKRETADQLEQIVGDWDGFKEAYQLRNDIVHGRKGSGGAQFLGRRVELILAASSAVAEYGRQRDADPYKRLRGKAVLTSPTRRRSK